MTLVGRSLSFWSLDGAAAAFIYAPDVRAWTSRPRFRRPVIPSSRAPVSDGRRHFDHFEFRRLPASRQIAAAQRKASRPEI